MYLTGGLTPDGPITVNKVTARKDEWNFVIQIGFENRLYLSTAEANTLIAALAVSMYDADSISMATAERLQYLAQAILMDAAEYREVVAMEAGEDF